MPSLPIPGDPTTIGDWGDTLNTFLGVMLNSDGTLKGSGYTLLVAASDAPQLVKNRADYVCDGTADQVQIQAAHDATGCNHVHLAGHTFSITSPLRFTKQGFTLSGDGYGDAGSTGRVGQGTLISIANGANFNVSNTDEAALMFSSSTRDVNSDFTPVVKSTCRDLSVNCATTTGADGQPIHGILWCVQLGKLSHVLVTNAATGGDGIRLEGKSGDQLYDTKLDHIDVRGCGGWGINGAKTCGDSIVGHFVIKDCGTSGTVGGGMKSSAAWQIYSGQIYSCNGVGVKVTNDDVQLVNLKIEHCAKGVWATAGTRLQIDACRFAANCADATNTNWIDVHLDGTTVWSIAGGTAFKATPDGTAHSLYNIKVENTSDNGHITDCIFDGATTISDGVTPSPAILIGASAQNITIEGNHNFWTDHEGISTITAAAGGSTIAHLLGTHNGVAATLKDSTSMTPTSVTCSLSGTPPVPGAIIVVTARSTTTFTVKLYNSSTGAQITSGSYDIAWRASKRHWL